jgi:hypothetical protein
MFTVVSCAGAAPDAIVGDLAPSTFFGEVDGVAAYAFGYATCNLGDAPLVYVANTSNHPLWTQNLYRLKDGLFQQIGLGHVVHGFFALEQNLCAPCTSVGMGNLGPGCSDVNSAGLAGSQNQLGPRWQVNAFTGEFAYPFFNAQPIPGTIGRRMQTHVSDVDPAQNEGAIYWAEVQVVAPGETSQFDRDNNASSRRVQFSSTLTTTYVEPVRREVSALQAWAALDPEVRVSRVDTNDDGAFFVASRAYDNGDGTWLYVYAIHNQNSDRSARAFQMDLGSGTVTDPNFHSPFYHSGDGVDGVSIPNDPWTFSFNDEKARWETKTFDENPNANALRWATVYTFWFTSDREPNTFDADITLFKPTPNDPEASDTYNASVIKPRSCLADFDNGGTVNFADLNQVLAAFGQTGEGLLADANNDGVVDFQDLNSTLAEFGRFDCY